MSFLVPMRFIYVTELVIATFIVKQCLLYIYISTYQFLICLLLSICGGSLYEEPLLDICCEYFLPVLGLANNL